MINKEILESKILSKKPISKPKQDGTYLNMIVGTIETIQDSNQAKIQFDYVGFDSIVTKIENLYLDEIVQFQYELCKMKNDHARYQYLDKTGAWKFLTDKDKKPTGPWEFKLRITNINKNQGTNQNIKSEIDLSNNKILNWDKDTDELINEINKTSIIDKKRSKDEIILSADESILWD